MIATFNVNPTLSLSSIGIQGLFDGFRIRAAYYAEPPLLSLEEQRREVDKVGR